MDTILKKIEKYEKKISKSLSDEERNIYEKKLEEYNDKINNVLQEKNFKINNDLGTMHKELNTMNNNLVGGTPPISIDEICKTAGKYYADVDKYAKVTEELHLKIINFSINDIDLRIEDKGYIDLMIKFIQNINIVLLKTIKLYNEYFALFEELYEKIKDCYTKTRVVTDIKIDHDKYKTDLAEEDSEIRKMNLLDNKHIGSNKIDFKTDMTLNVKTGDADFDTNMEKEFKEMLKKIEQSKKKLELSGGGMMVNQMGGMTDKQEKAYEEMMRKRDYLNQRYLQIQTKPTRANNVSVTGKSIHELFNQVMKYYLTTFMNLNTTYETMIIKLEDCKCGKIEHEECHFDVVIPEKLTMIPAECIEETDANGKTTITIGQPARNSPDVTDYITNLGKLINDVDADIPDDNDDRSKIKPSSDITLEVDPGPTNASGAPTNASGAPTNASGAPTNASGAPTNASGAPTNASGAPNAQTPDEEAKRQKERDEEAKRQQEREDVRRRLEEEKERKEKEARDAEELRKKEEELRKREEEVRKREEEAKAREEEKRPPPEPDPVEQPRKPRVVPNVAASVSTDSAAGSSGIPKNEMINEKLAGLNLDDVTVDNINDMFTSDMLPLDPVQEGGRLLIGGAMSRKSYLEKLNTLHSVAKKILRNHICMRIASLEKNVLVSILKSGFNYTDENINIICSFIRYFVYPNVSQYDKTLLGTHIVENKVAYEKETNKFTKYCNMLGYHDRDERVLRIDILFEYLILHANVTKADPIDDELYRLLDELFRKIKEGMAYSKSVLALLNRDVYDRNQSDKTKLNYYNNYIDQENPNQILTYCKIRIDSENDVYEHNMRFVPKLSEDKRRMDVWYNDTQIPFYDKYGPTFGKLPKRIFDLYEIFTNPEGQKEYRTSTNFYVNNIALPNINVMISRKESDYATLGKTDGTKRNLEGKKFAFNRDNMDYYYNIGNTIMHIDKRTDFGKKLFKYFDEKTGKPKNPSLYKQTYIKRVESETSSNPDYLLVLGGDINMCISVMTEKTCGIDVKKHCLVQGNNETKIEYEEPVQRIERITKERNTAKETDEKELEKIFADRLTKVERKIAASANNKMELAAANKEKKQIETEKKRKSAELKKKHADIFKKTAHLEIIFNDCGEQKTIHLRSENKERVASKIYGSYYVGTGAISLPYLHPNKIQELFYGDGESHLRVEISIIKKEINFKEEYFLYFNSTGKFIVEPNTFARKELELFKNFKLIEMYNNEEERKIGLNLKLTNPAEHIDDVINGVYVDNDTVGYVSKYLFTYNYLYKFGPFTEIYEKDIINSKIANNKDSQVNVIKNLIRNGRNVTIIGYGASGSGKTSTLVFFKPPGQKGTNGILIEICNDLKNDFVEIGVSFLEFMADVDGMMSSLKKEGILQADRERINNANTPILNTVRGNTYGRKIEIGEISSGGGQIGGEQNDEAETDWKQTGGLQRGIFSEQLFKPSGDDWIAKNTIRRLDKGSINGKAPVKNIEFTNNQPTIGEYIEKIMENVREIEPTPNNKDSSRSHMIIFVQFKKSNGKGPYLCVCDFAGVENKFKCGEQETLNNFLRLEKDPPVQYYGGPINADKEKEFVEKIDPKYLGGVTYADLKKMDKDMDSGIPKMDGENFDKRYKKNAYFNSGYSKSNIYKSIVEEAKALTFKTYDDYVTLLENENIKSFIETFETNEELQDKVYKAFIDGYEQRMSDKFSPFIKEKLDNVMWNSLVGITGPKQDPRVVWLRKILDAVLEDTTVQNFVNYIAPDVGGGKRNFELASLMYGGCISIEDLYFNIFVQMLMYHKEFAKNNETPIIEPAKFSVVLEGIKMSTGKKLDVAKFSIMMSDPTAKLSRFMYFNNGCFLKKDEVLLALKYPIMDGLKTYFDSDVSIKKICLERMCEGLFINNSLKQLKEIIGYLLNKVQRGDYSAEIPNFDDYCMKKQCGLLDRDCFTYKSKNKLIDRIESTYFDANKDTEEENTKEVMRKVFKDINKTNPNNPVMIQELNNKTCNTVSMDCIKNMVFCVFLVVNFSRHVITNNPPPVPYVDCTQLKSELHRLSTAEDDLIPNENEFPDYMDTMHMKFSNAKDINRNLLYRYYTKDLDKVPTKISKDKDLLQYIAKEPLLKMYDQSSLDIINLSIENIVTANETKDKRTGIEIIIKEIMSSNDKSTIGTIEYADSMAKHGVGDIICNYEVNPTILEGGNIKKNKKYKIVKKIEDGHGMDNSVSEGGNKKYKTIKKMNGGIIDYSILKDVEKKPDINFGTKDKCNATNMESCGLMKSYYLSFMNENDYNNMVKNTQDFNAPEPKKKPKRKASRG